MSYTTKIKNELLKMEIQKSETIALLSGFIRNSGYFNNDVFCLSTENIYMKEMLEKSFMNLYHIEVSIDIKPGLNFSKRDLYVIRVEEKSQIILKDLGYYGEDLKYLEIPPEYITGSTEEEKAYLRGVFLSQGSINDPQTSQYHMEIVIAKPEEAIFVQKILNQYELNAKILNRDKGYMIYIKEAEKISDFLKMIGAMQATLYFENVRIYHDKKNHTNRLNNCEQANTDKIVEAATIQLKNIEILEENVAVELLDDKTKEALEYRKKYPEASLKELSSILSMETGKSITKSGLNHRFRKIAELASKFKS